MRKDQVQKEVRERLAMIGYSAGHYAWPKRGRLRVLINANAAIKGEPRAQGDGKYESPMAEAFLEPRLPSGISRKRLMGELDRIPTRGPARPVPTPAYRDQQIQHELDTQPC